MDFHQYSEKINQEITGHGLIIMPVTCSIEYWGRSRSVIGEGDRLIVFKPDTTLLVHSPNGFKPLNWMSSPTDTLAEPGDSHLLLHSQRTKSPYEEMKIKITKIHDFHSYCGLRDGEKLDLTHTERDMQEYLSKNPKQVHPAFRLKATEYRTPLGFLDLYGKIGEKYAIIELKCDKAGLPAALQIKRYAEWMESHVKQDVHSILMAPSITENALKILKKSGIEFKKFNIKKVKRKPLTRNTLTKWLE